MLDIHGHRDISPDGSLWKGGQHAAQRAALEEQKNARAQSAAQFAVQMKLMQQQMKSANQVEIPKVLPASPPNRESEQTLAASQDQRRAAGRRFSFNSARMAGKSSFVQNLLGTVSNLGA